MDSSKYYSLPDLLNIIGGETYCAIVLQEYVPRGRRKEPKDKDKDKNDGKKKRV